MKLLNLNQTYESVKSAHFYNGYIKKPSIQELNQIEKCVKSLDWKGKTATLGSLLGLGLSWYLWQSGDPGPLLSVIVGTASVATFIVARDLQAIAEALEEEYINRVSSRSYFSWLTSEVVFENKFEKKFKTTANKNTLLVKV